MMDELDRKASLRQSVLKEREEISKSQREILDEKITGHFFESFDLSDVGSVLCYNSLPQEVDTSKIAEKLLEKGIKLYFPKTLDEGKMKFFEICKNTKLVSGFKGVLEPEGDTCEYEGEDALCIVPGLCFSESGQRLGYGAGYYDRFLCGKSMKKIALSYSCFIKTEIPCSQHDVRMDYIITEHGVIDCAERSGGKR